MGPDKGAEFECEVNTEGCEDAKFTQATCRVSTCTFQECTSSVESDCRIPLRIVIMLPVDATEAINDNE